MAAKRGAAVAEAARRVGGYGTGSHRAALEASATEVLYSFARSKAPFEQRDIIDGIVAGLPPAHRVRYRAAKHTNGLGTYVKNALVFLRGSGHAVRSERTTVSFTGQKAMQYLWGGKAAHVAVNEEAGRRLENLEESVAKRMSYKFDDPVRGYKLVLTLLKGERGVDSGELGKLGVRAHNLLTKVNSIGRQAIGKPLLAAEVVHSSDSNVVRWTVLRRLRR